MSGSPESAGSLVVDLDMPTGPLAADVNAAQAHLDRLSNKIGITAGIASAAGTIIGTFLARGISYVAREVKEAVKHIDDLNDAAKRINISVEHFSALEYIVKQTGATIQNVETAFRTLNNAMDDTAAKKTTAAARAFEALGIKVQDVNGKLRNSHDVFLDVAEKFKDMEAGAKKTALAVDLFGRSGTALIQTLDLGKDGIEEMTKAAKAMGYVIGTDSAESIATFNDGIDKMKARLDSLWRMIATVLVPILNQMYVVLNRFAMSLGAIAHEAIALKTYLENLFTNGHTAALFAYSQQVDGLRKNFRAMSLEFEKGINAPAPPKGTAGTVAAPSSAISPKVKQIKEEIKAREEQITVEQLFFAEMEKQNAAQEYNNSIRDIELQQYTALNESRYLTMEQFGQLNQLLADGVITTQQYNDAMVGLGSTMDSSIELAATKIGSNLKRIESFFKNTANASTASWLSMADTIVDTLGMIFGESKEFAIAAAIINTAQAITKTLAEVPYPLNIAAAAMVAAMGAAQIAKIASTNKGGGSAAPTVSGGGAGGGASSSAPANGTPQTLYVQGIDPSQLYSGETVRNLADQLLQYQRDGGRVVLQGAQ